MSSRKTQPLRWTARAAWACAIAVLAPLAAWPQVVDVQTHGEALAPLLSAAEQRAWRGASDDAALRAVVDAFWEARDPTPGTAANEARAIFERRLERAARFQEGAVAGHLTDRGRVLLVLGLPDEYEMRAVPAGRERALRWSYDREPFEGTIEFRPAAEGFELATDVPLDARHFLASLEADLRAALAGAPGGRRTAVVVPELEEDDEEGEETGADEPEPLPTPEVTPAVRAWMAMVFEGVMRDELELRHRLDTFPAPDGTYTVLAFALGRDALTFADPQEGEEDDEGEMDEYLRELVEQQRGEALQETIPEAPLERVASLTVFGAVLEGDPGVETTVHQFVVPYSLAETAYLPEEDSDTVRAAPDSYTEDDVLRRNYRNTPTLSLGMTLRPGSYRLAWGVIDETTGAVTTRDERIEIPDYEADGLRLTRPVVAEPPHAEDLEAIRTDRLYEGVRLGSMRLLDEVERTYARDAILEIVVIASGWQSDPVAPGKPRLEVDYRIVQEGVELPSVTELTTQLLDFHVLGQQIPLQQISWLDAGGDVRVEIVVRDLIAGSTASQSLRLRVLPAVEPANSLPR